jgi:hypothetical protein
MKGMNYLLDPACVTQPISLEDCDQASPPNCRRIRMHYKRGCEQVTIGK